MVLYAFLDCLPYMTIGGSRLGKRILILHDHWVLIALEQVIGNQSEHIIEELGNIMSIDISETRHPRLSIIESLLNNL